MHLGHVRASTKQLESRENVAMRLTTDQVRAIRQTAQRVLGAGARVSVFGSRALDDRKGGDIDLLFETDALLDNRAKILCQLHGALTLALELARKEAAHLRYTHRTLFALPIDAAWVAQLSSRDDLAEKIDAFVSRFGRLQDHLLAKSGWYVGPPHFLRGSR